MAVNRKEGKVVSTADKLPVSQARAARANTTPEISVTPATSTTASHGRSTFTKPTKTGRLFKAPSTSSMSSPDPDEGDAAASSISSAPSQSSRTPDGTAQQHGFIRGKVNGSRYPTKNGWHVREQDEPVPGRPPCISRGTANVFATYQYTKDEEKNKLADGFTLTSEYSQVLAEALCSMIDQNPRDSKDKELQLDTAYALACGRKRWHWRLDFTKVEPERAWTWARQQFSSAGIRLLLADYIECLTQVTMPDGKCDANCVKIYLGKFLLDDAASEMARTAGASTEAIDSFVDFPTASPILIITLQLIERSRSSSPWRILYR
ncbi:MAG: hypothetical protein Q9165_005911 [Trypethelium subeluteriae]